MKQRAIFPYRHLLAAGDIHPLLLLMYGSLRQMLYHLSRMPFIDPAELAGVLSEPHSTVQNRLTELLDDCITERFPTG